MARPNLLFVDANIWLDFYRASNDTALRLLDHTEALADKLIVTYQLENEYKRNRQAAIVQGMQELKPPQQIPRPGIFSDAAAARMLAKNMKEAEKRVRKLRDRMAKALRNPAAHDPVYQSCQRLFQRKDDLVLTRENPLRRIIRRRAFKRFLHGCMPRKRDDISIGDAFNWEWMVHCATQKKAGLVIVTRDSDYGPTFDKEPYINDALRQEFGERVSRRRELRLCLRLSDALKLFDVKVTAQEEATETELLSSRSLDSLSLLGSNPTAQSFYTSAASGYRIPIDSSTDFVPRIRGVNVYPSNSLAALLGTPFDNIQIETSAPPIPPSESDWASGLSKPSDAMREAMRRKKK